MTKATDVRHAVHAFQTDLDNCFVFIYFFFAFCSCPIMYCWKCLFGKMVFILIFNVSDSWFGACLHFTQQQLWKISQPAEHRAVLYHVIHKHTNWPLSECRGHRWPCRAGLFHSCLGTGAEVGTTRPLYNPSPRYQSVNCSWSSVVTPPALGTWQHK